MKGKALRKHSLHEKTAVSVLLKLFTSSTKIMPHHWRPLAYYRTPFSNVNNIHVHSMIPEDQKNITTQYHNMLTCIIFCSCRQVLSRQHGQCSGHPGHRLPHRYLWLPGGSLLIGQLHCVWCWLLLWQPW